MIGFVERRKNQKPTWLWSQHALSLKHVLVELIIKVSKRFLLELKLDTNYNFFLDFRLFCL